MNNNPRSYFKDKLKPAFTYIGTIGASIMVICYIITVLILVFGFKVQENHLKSSITFACVNGVVGFIIMQFLKIQGIDFAKSEHTELIDEYEKIVLKEELIKRKGKQPKTMNYYWVTTVLKDLLSKFLTIVVASCGMIYIVIEGSTDYSLILLAIVNLLMFACFGLLSLVSAYDFYNTQHVNYMKYKIKDNKDKEDNEEFIGDDENNVQD